MRKIKFRAWVKPKKQMWAVLAIDWHDEKQICNGGDYAPISEVILMQFTGLIDKSGKEIYEGDVVNGNRIVHWQDFGFWPFNLMKEGTIESGALRNIEVIGNIYDPRTREIC